MKDLLQLLSNVTVLLIIAGVLTGVFAALGTCEVRGVRLAVGSRAGRVGLAVMSGVLLLAALLSVGVPALRGPANRSTIDLSGSWKIDLRRADSTVRGGSATICQPPGSHLVDIAMQMESRSGPPGRVNTLAVTGRLRGTTLYGFYEVPSGDRGAVVGTIQGGQPQTFVLRYVDLIGFDTNRDPSGDIEFTRLPARADRPSCEPAP